MYIGVTGEPGSGKSAFAVNYIIENEKVYNKIYVNINGFKFNKLEKKIKNFVWGVPHNNIPNIIVSYKIYIFLRSLNLFSPRHAKPLNFPEIYDIASHCKDIYDVQIANLGKEADENEIDKPIIDYLISIGFLKLNQNYLKYQEELKERNSEKLFKRLYLNVFKRISKVVKYRPTLFVIDEAQNHMGAIDPMTGKELRTADHVLIWLVSYHRHLYMDFIALSQQYQKIHIAYRRDFSYFLDAVESQSLLWGRFSSYLVYDKYKESPYTNKNKTAKVRVKKTDKLFDFYESGDEVRSKSVILPWIIFSIVLLIFAIIIFSYVISSFNSDDSVDNNVTKIKKSSPVKIIGSTTEIVPSIGGKTYYLFSCIADTCSNKELKIELNIDDLIFLVNSTDSKFLSTKKYSSKFASISLLASSDFVNLFNGAKNGKNNTQGFSLIN